MSRVKLSSIVKRFGDFTALHELDLEIQEGEFLSLLGPSGCGKTTTLRLIAGFIQPTQGTILLGDEDVTRVAPQHREIGMVFQDYALFPHMTIAQNIGFGLQERRYPKAQIDERVKELLDLIHLSDVGDRYPAEVSGGQQQRIAVARAVAYPPRVLLMDEPLGALDLKLRETMQLELRRIQQELKITTVYVTHDQTEAMNMSDRIVVMNTGRIEQIGGAEDIYNEPRTRFVADFVGQINLLDGEILGSEGEFLMAQILGTKIRVPRVNGTEQGEVSIAVRPEHLHLLDNDATDGDLNVIRGTLSGRTFAGNLTRLFVDVGDEKQIVIEARSQDAPRQMGTSINVGWQPADSRVLMK
ncbi:MAG: ABC transporter ATP-binding protein [Gammaproteobacteria bacterium]|nr:ABC transporter ATP-binding protein [Gammaproteobacteria bacterium]MDH3856469.1 ABC transporter ATP-binding protein [Gammaproteobacteria bacterium]